MGNPPYNPNNGQYQQQPNTYEQQPQQQPPKKSMALPIIIIAVVVVVVVAVALMFMLGGDDEGGGGIEDTWNIDTMTTNVAGYSTTVDVSAAITFNPDGTYTSTGGATYFSTSGTYSTSGNIMVIDGTSWEYTMTGNSLTLEWSVSYFGIETTTTYSCSRA